MSDVSTWDTNANNNNQPPPDGFPEGQTPGSLNDCSREVMAAVARWRDSFYVYGPATFYGPVTVGQTAIVKIEDGSTIGNIGTSSNHPLSIISNDAERMRIDTDANVGIGGVPLAIANIRDLTIHGQSSGTLLSLKDNADARKTELSWDAGTATGTVGTFSSNPFQIRTNDTARLIFSSAGDASFTENIVIASDKYFGLNNFNYLGFISSGWRLASSSNLFLNSDSDGNAAAGLFYQDGIPGSATDVFFVNSSKQMFLINSGVVYDSTPGAGTYGLYMQADSGGTVHIDGYSSGGSTQLALGTNSAGGAISAGLTIGNDLSLTAPQVYNTTVTSARDVQVQSNGLLGYVTSSTRYKKHIKPLKDSDFVSKLRPVEYDREDGTHEIGLLAEEVEEVAPQYVWRDEIGRPDGVDYKGLIVPILARLQQLEARCLT